MSKAQLVRLVQHEENGDPLLIYSNARGAKVELPYRDETLWATQKQMSEMFGVQVPAVSKHLRNIFEEGELIEAEVMSSMEITATDGRPYPTKVYNLNAIISVGYRVESKVGTTFRIWATNIIVQILTKGFYVDVERLKHGGDFDRIRELREIIRDLRSDEANLYAELRGICAMCKDYDGKSQTARTFYSHMQAKLFHAVVSNTPSEILATRIRADKPNVGLQNWSGDSVRKLDVTVAKYALTETELRELNRVTDILLSIFEDQLDVGRLVKMTDAERLLDQQLKQLGRSVLRGGGSVSTDDAHAYAKAEYKKYDERRKLERRQQVQTELAALKAETKKLPKPRKAK